MLSSQATFFHELYLPLLGKPIRTVAWLPIACDTSGVVGVRDAAHLTFSGGSLVVAEDGAQVFLTWKQAGDRFALTGSEAETGWISDALDRVQIGSDGPWNAVRGAVLSGAHFYAEADDPLARVVGVRHVLQSENSDNFVWIGCGGDGFIAESDDLWVSIGIEPANLANLVVRE